MHDFNKALAYLNNNKYEKAAALFRRLEKDNKYKEIYLNLGTAYRALGQYDKAVECFLTANNPLVPFTDNTFIDKYTLALNNLGLIAYTHEQDDVAAKFYKEALAIDPYYHDAKWNLSNVFLRQYCSNNKSVNLQDAYKLFDSRFHRPGGVKLKSRKRLIDWNFLDKVDSICVLSEQGMGDQIMFARYLSTLEQYADKIWIQCNPRLNSLYDKYLTCEDPSETDAAYGVPMCSLGKLLDYIPSGDWLKHKYVKKTPNEILDIGVTWSGSSSFGNNEHRSTTSGRFLQLSKYGNLYTLNPAEVNTRGFISLDSGSWADTVRELSRLDLVITVDTSISHLCGSMGMPCWVLMPTRDSDFRWGTSEMGFDNVWYDSVRVIRNPGNWEDTFDIVKVLLENSKDFVR